MNNSELVILVQRCIQNDRTAFVQLCEAKARDVLYICIKLMGNQHDGEDAAQEVMLRMQKSIGRLRDAQTFPAWLNRIISTTCLDMRRKTMKKDTPVNWDDMAEPVQESNIEFLPELFAEKQENRRLVLEALRSLPYKNQEILLMFYFENLSMQDIALALGVSTKAVDGLLQRSRKSLYAKLENRVGHTETVLAVAPIPVLSRILQDEAPQLVTNEAIQKTIAAATPKNPPPARKSGVQAALKTAAVALVTVAAVAGGFFATNTPTPPGIIAQQVVQPPSSLSGVQQNTPADATSAYSQADSEPQSAASKGVHIAVQVPLASMPAEPPAPAPSASQPSPPSSVGSQPSVYTARFSGSVQLVDARNASVAGGGQYAAGYTARLLHGTDVLDEATVQQNGGYNLTASVQNAQTYTVVLLPASGAQCTFAPANPTGNASFVMQTGTKKLPALYITDTESPTGGIEFYTAEGAAMEGGFVNPGAVRLTYADATATTIYWAITDNALATSTLSGSGSQVSLGAGSLPATNQGQWYTIAFIITDAVGNTTAIERQFVVFA